MQKQQRHEVNWETGMKFVMRDWILFAVFAALYWHFTGEKFPRFDSETRFACYSYINCWVMHYIELNASLNAEIIKMIENLTERIDELEGQA